METVRPTTSAAPMIVVGVDDRRLVASGPDLRAAAAEARRRGATIRVVHGCATRSPAGIIGDYVTQERTSYGRQVLDVAVQALRELTRGEVTITSANSNDLAADALLAESATAALVVMLHRRSTYDGPTTGITTRSVAGLARCPVLILPQDVVTTDPAGDVVVGVGDRGPSGALVHAAAAEAAWRAVPLTVVHAWRPSSDGWAVQGPAMTEHTGGVAEMAARARLLAATAELAAAFPDVVVRSELVRGSSVDVLLKWSSRAGLLVVGRGLGRPPDGSAMGGVAAALVDRARCPLLVGAGGPSSVRTGAEAAVRLNAAFSG